MANATPSPTKVTSLNPNYIINGSTNIVSLNTVIGDPGQTSKTTVTLTNTAGTQTELLTGYDGNVPSTNIGQNKDLDGCVLTISCFITVTSSASNYCEELIVVKGGTSTKQYKLYDSTLTSQGQSATLTCIITFIKP